MGTYEITIVYLEDLLAEVLKRVQGKKNLLAWKNDLNATKKDMSAYLKEKKSEENIKETLIAKGVQILKIKRSLGDEEGKAEELKKTQEELNALAEEAGVKDDVDREAKEYEDLIKKNNCDNPELRPDAEFGARDFGCPGDFETRLLQMTVRAAREYDTSGCLQKIRLAALAKAEKFLAESGSPQKFANLLLGELDKVKMELARDTVAAEKEVKKLDGQTEFFGTSFPTDKKKKE